MIKTYILGTGFLSNNLQKKINNSEILSANKFLNKINLINIKKNKINLIINSFYSSKKLNENSSFKNFTKKSLLDISEIFDKANPNLIKKIVYTSSSSVYGSINSKITINDQNNRYLYSSFKLAAETMLKNSKNNKNYQLYIYILFKERHTHISLQNRSDSRSRQ